PIAGQWNGRWVERGDAGGPATRHAPPAFLPSPCLSPAGDQGHERTRVLEGRTGPQCFEVHPTDPVVMIDGAFDSWVPSGDVRARGPGTTINVALEVGAANGPTGVGHELSERLRGGHGCPCSPPPLPGRRDRNKESAAPGTGRGCDRCCSGRDRSLRPCAPPDVHETHHHAATHRGTGGGMGRGLHRRPQV